MMREGNPSSRRLTILKNTHNNSSTRKTGPTTAGGHSVTFKEPQDDRLIEVHEFRETSSIKKHQV